jgi:hypothetical protein
MDEVVKSLQLLAAGADAQAESDGRRHQDGDDVSGTRRTVVAIAGSEGSHGPICTALVSAVAWWGHLVMLAGWSLLGLWATRNGKAFGPREVLHDDVTTARCDHRSGPNDRSMR